jgi:thiol-disulfide isomerase/thioredoxin
MFKQFVLSLSLASFCFAAILPRPAGDVPFTIPGKGPDKLENYRGKVVMLMIFLTNCPECQRSVKVLSAIEKDYKPHGLRTIALAFHPDDNEAAVKKFVQTYKPSFPVGMIDGLLLLSFGQLTAERRTTVPMLFFIDRKGVVVSQYFGGDPFMQEQYLDTNVRAKLMNLLQAGGALNGVKPASPKLAPAKK